MKALPVPVATSPALQTLTAELGGKRLELLKDAVPKVTRVAILYDPAIPSSVLEVKESLPVAARALRLTIQPWEVRDGDDFDKVFCCDGQAAPGRTLRDLGSSLTFANRKRIADFAVNEPVAVDVRQTESL